MYASEAELHEVKSKLLNSGVLPLDLEAQIEGTFSFRNAGIPTHIYEQVRKAGFQVLERTTIEGRNSEYTIARIPAAATAPAAGGDVVAYTWNGGSIGWDNALDAIEQLVLDCTGSKDTRFLQETLDSIYAIVTTEKAAQASEGGV